MSKIQSQSTTHTSSISQAAAVAALNGSLGFLAEWLAAFRQRRDLVVEMINATEGLSCNTPSGAFYVYPSCAGIIGRKTPDGTTISDDSGFIAYLLESEGVAAVQGAAFGLEPYFRISYATSMDKLEQACARIQRACAVLS
jgi:aspartate aminotransferase